MEAPYSAVLGAMGSILMKLCELPPTEGRAKQLRDEAHQLRQIVDSISTKLELLSEVHDPPLAVNYWKKDARELSYDMEDFVDQCVQLGGADEEIITSCVDQISRFKSRIEEMKERYAKYKLKDVLVHTRNTRLPKVYGRLEPHLCDLVGMDGPANEINRLLTPKGEGDEELKVFSILGNEGIGKSTLSQKLWHEIGGDFECRAFVQTAKRPDMRMILRSILLQIRPKQQLPEACQVPNLIHDIRMHLQDKRYMIIIDDLWAVSVWDVVSRAFPEGNCRSRIVITTTIEDVALACCGYDTELIFRMKPLSEDQSKILFFSAAFGPGKGSPQEFNEVSDKIIMKCGGLPLAIICIGKIVASQPDKQQQECALNFLLDNFKTNTTSVEILNQVLELCYSCLPHCLKSCLLYLSVYPENYLILKEDLVKQWIAEDFFSTTEENNIAEVASSYFDNLVSLGLIQQMNINSNNKEFPFVVHPVVFDFVTCKSMKDNFITIIDYSQSTVAHTDKIRRLCLNFGSATYATPPAGISVSQVRSLAFMGLLKCMPSLVEFRLVRIVILHLRGNDKDTRFSLAEIHKLLLLRYLQVRCNVTVELPVQIKCLQHLETLEIIGIVVAIPSDIAHVPRLSDVYIGGKKNNKHVTLGPIASSKAISMDDSSGAPTPSVQIFELLPPICIYSKLPEWISQLHRLYILVIVVRGLQLKDIDVLGKLPALASLSLYVRTSTTGHIVFSRGAFQALGYFKFVCGVALLNFQEEAMPNLRRFKIGFNAHRGQKYGHMLGGIQHLLNLEEISASTGMASGAEESDRIAAETALRDAISNHPCDISFKVKRVDPVDEEYGDSDIQNWSQETEQCEIQEDDFPIEEKTDLSTMGTMWPKCRIFTEDEIKRITGNYSILIGKGGFGEVYKGILEDEYDVAVKRYIGQNLREDFIEAVNILSEMSHKNMVKLIGYCTGENTFALVTEYISKGNVDDILHKSNIPITLDIRLGIAIGCAEALSYMHSLHFSSNSLVCHGDIKPANILLDENFAPKVSDFGVSRLLSTRSNQYTCNEAGSIDYMDPIYFTGECLTPQSDVYSFGIVLLELVTRKRAKQGDINNIRFFFGDRRKGFRRLFDASIANAATLGILDEVAKLVTECLRLHIHNRPQIKNVAKRLWVLKRFLKSRHENRLLLWAHSTWHKKYKKDKVQLMKSFFKINTRKYKILSELSNVRSFTKQEVEEITDNYSYLLSGGTSTNKYYKATLEDNTVVVVSKLLSPDSKEVFINGGIILSQIVHKNIIKLLGCCLKDETLIYIYEYASKGSLSNILRSKDGFPLDMRMRIATKTAEALQYLHSSATGVIGHGSVSESTILLDNNFNPKLAGFSGACKLIESGNGSDDRVLSNDLLAQVLKSDPSRYRSVLVNVESDVYRFGSVLFSLISRENNTDDLVVKFTKAYEIHNSGRAMFDKTIIDDTDITVLEEIGRLALKCTNLDVDKMLERPTMKEVVEHLRLIRRSWKERMAGAPTQVTQTDVPSMTSDEPRIPNQMRQLLQRW